MPTTSCEHSKLVYIRKLKDKDVGILQEYCRQSGKFPFPDLSNPNIIISGVVCDSEDNIMGFGCIKLVGEAIVVLDPGLRDRDKVAVLRDLFMTGKAMATRKRLDQMIACINNNSSFAQVLERSFSFKKSKDDYYFLNLE